MRVHPSPKLLAYPTIGVLFLLTGVLLARVEAAEIGIGFLAAAVVGILLARRPGVAATAQLRTDSVLEDEPASLEVTLIGSDLVPWLSVSVPASRALERSGGTGDDAVSLGEVKRRVSIPLVPRRWGVFQLGPVMLRARDSLGFFKYESELSERMVLRVFPHEELLARAIRPAETQPFAGDEVARRKGEGIEFAGVRRFEPGDRVRRINWAVSTRLQKLHVNEAHPERNTDVVIFLDSFSEVGDGRDSTLLMAVRATATVARHYLGRRDRVGVVSFGGTLRWQVPGMGVRQAYRILDALLRTDAMFSYAWKGIDVIPSQTLPPKALVIAITPLIDPRTTAALLELRGRGFDLVIVEVSPLPFIDFQRTEDERLAYRLWLLKREQMRYDYWSAGVPVATWTRGQPLVAALQEVERFRRFGRNLRIS